MTTTQQLLGQAVRLYRLAEACPIGRAEIHRLGRKYASARMRYANAAGLSEKAADVIIQQKAREP